MENKKKVLIVGIDPFVIDFSSGDFASTNLSSEKVLASLRGDADQLRGLGYEVDLCLTDLGKTAGQLVEDTLKAKPYDCVVVGAGIRVIPSSFLLFEKLMNVIHANAPHAKLCFNTTPADTAEAVMRWV